MFRPPRRAVNSFKTNLVVAQKRLDGGTLLKSDVLDIEVRLAQSRKKTWFAPAMPTLLAERALRNLLGIEDGDFTVADTAPAVSAPYVEDFSQRPELAAARERESAAQAQVRGARAATSRASAPSAVWIMITAG